MTNVLGYLCSSISWGGLEMNQMKNALWMKERGHQVYVFCKLESPIYKACLEAEIAIIQIGNHKKYYDFKAGKALAYKLDEHQITHLIVRDTRDMSIAVSAKRKSKRKIHLSYFNEMQFGVKKTNLLHTIRFSYFDLWSSPLNWLAKQVETMTNFNKKKICIIPSGLDLRVFENELSRDEARDLLKFPKDKIIFGLIGRFDPDKGQVLLLEALSKINNPNVCICLLGEPTIGEGNSYSDLMNLTIENNQLSDRVFIRPFMKDIKPFFNAIDAFVMASKAETFGMVTIESMACGTPVLASNSGGSIEILDFGKFGLLFTPLDSNSLAKKMNHFVEFPTEFPSQALKEEATKYDHNKVCEMVEEKLGL
jgi:glycosyltransferase involved in cell wall biosynthesis